MFHAPTTLYVRVHMYEAFQHEISQLLSNMISRI